MDGDGSNTNSTSISKLHAVENRPRWALLGCWPFYALRIFGGNSLPKRGRRREKSRICPIVHDFITKIQVHVIINRVLPVLK